MDIHKRRHCISNIGLLWINSRSISLTKKMESGSRCERLTVEPFTSRKHGIFLKLMQLMYIYIYITCLSSILGVPFHSN